MRNNALKQKQKAKNGITALATQTESLALTIEAINEGFKNHCKEKFTEEELASLSEFSELSETLSEGLKRYAKYLDEYSKLI